MTSTINASTTAGLVQTADTSGVLALQTAGTTAVTVDASQNVGIGTASPANKLHVFGTEVRVQQNASYYSLFDTAGTRYGYIQGGSGYLDIVSETGSANTIRFTANSSERARINTYGIGLGGTVPSSGMGIAFPATQSASSDANTLDDYEEGTWSAVVTAESGSITTYGIDSATYTKTGNTVYVYLRFNVSNKGTGSNFVVSGLPFTAARELLGIWGETNTTGLTGFMFNAGTGATSFSSRLASSWAGACLVNGNYTVQVTYRV